MSGDHTQSDLFKCKLWSGLFLVVINTECEGVCYRIRPAKIPNNARAPLGTRALLSIYYYYKDWPTWLKEISIYFYEVTRTRTPPYCFECIIALVKADNFTIDIQSSNRNSTSVSQRAVIGGFTPCLFYAHRRVFVHCAFPVIIIKNNA